MATFTANFFTYRPNGSVLTSGDTENYTSSGTNDGTWDQGDSLANGSDYSYDGSFTDGNGNTFLQFSNSDGRVTLLSNDVAVSDSPGFPAPFQDGDETLDSSPFALCFLSGTEIATPDGTALVEDLNIGDLIVTSDGTTVPVKWVGHQKIVTQFKAPERLMPVRFAAGSLGNGLPHSDLTVTADHAMLVDGVLCNASALVNDTTITRVPLAEMGKTFTVYHVETEEHEIILANGAPSETFIDNVSRRVFDNFAEFEALYGDEAEMTELLFPRAMSARQVPVSIKARLAGKIAA